MPRDRDIHAQLQFRRNLMIGVGIFVFLLSIFLITRFSGPRQLDPDMQWSEVEPIQKDLSEQRNQVDAYIEQFDVIREAREIESEDLDLVRLAVALQEDILRQSRETTEELKDTRRLQDLQKLRDDYEGAILKEASLDIERQARAAMEQNSMKAARDLFRQALSLQDRINREFARSSSRDLARMASLEKELENLEAWPLYQQSLEAEKAAEIALLKDDLRDAQSKLNRAIDAQVELNTRFRFSRYADFARIQSLEQRLTDLQVNSVIRRIQRLKDEAQKLAAEKLYEQSAEKYASASELQADLNQKFPQSSYASQTALEALEIDRQTVLSQPMADEIQAQMAALDVALQQRHIASAQRLIRQINGSLMEVQRRYKLSRHVQEENVSRVRFLALVSEHLQAIQDLVWDNLLPVEGHPDIQMFNREVSQILFTRVMGENPSSRLGDPLPVETLTWDEAREFNRRLGWILAAEVRLPTETEFRAALGTVEGQDWEANAWHSQNSGRLTQDVGTKLQSGGFTDLLGNVSEWLSNETQSQREALVIGGNARDNPLRLATVPMETREKNERSRFVGMRFVVEVNR